MKDCLNNFNNCLKSGLLNMDSIASSSDRHEEEDFGFSEPMMPPSSSLGFKIKSPPTRKITPPPWSMVVHIPAAKERLTKHSETINFSQNPFKRELLKSLTKNETNIVRTKKKQQRRLGSAERSCNSFPPQDSQPLSNQIKPEIKADVNNITKSVPNGILKRRERRNSKLNDVTSTTIIKEEVRLSDEFPQLKKKRTKKVQKLQDVKDQIITSCNKNFNQSKPMPSFLRSSLPSIPRICKEFDLEHSNLKRSKNLDIYSELKAIENRPSSLSNLLDEQEETDFHKGDLFYHFFNRGMNRPIKEFNRSSDWSNKFNGLHRNSDWSDNLKELQNGEWADNFKGLYNRELANSLRELHHNGELTTKALNHFDQESANQSKEYNNGERMYQIEEHIDDWNKLAVEPNVLHQTSTTKSVYFDLGSSTEELLSEYDECLKLNAERLLSICDSGIGIDDDFRSMSRSSLQVLSDDEENEEAMGVHRIPVDNAGDEDEAESPEREKWNNLEVLCGNRVSQMTQTYHDIEAVTRLLQEKEKDLELAARIGQQLLARNKCLEEKNSTLESDICLYTEKITQLKHDLQMKTDLLHVYINDFDESSADTTPTGIRHINIDILQARVKNLENENVSLRQEASQLACDTLDCEDKETELVHDVIKQLNDANLHVHQLSEELSRKIEDSLRQQEDTTQLLAQVVELQAINKRLNRENEELASLVTVARECQQELTTELAELKEKYAEVLDLLHDTQEQLRRFQKKNYPSSRGAHLSGLFSSTLSGHDSIASELHGLNSNVEDHEKVDGVKSLSRVFDTVRLTSKLGSSVPVMGYAGGSVYSTPTKLANLSHLNTPMHVSGGSHSSYFGSMTSSHMSMASSGLPSLDSGADSDGSFHTDSEDNYPASCNGVPGWPGTPDLDSCIRRLGPTGASPYLPYGCRTPDSIMSTGSGKSGLSGYSGSGWRLPQKLQIVKPIEGSLTLHQWSRLATPHLGGLLEEREGVAIKGAMNADLNLELYSMSDYEEDEDEKDYPGKQFMQTTGIYTYTNSTVLHPDDVTSLTPSLRPTQSSVLQTSLASQTGMNGSQSSSRPASRRGSTATFSTNVGLAKHLLERGIAQQIPEGIIPTATPANSPSGSRPGSPEPQETYKLPSFEEFTKSIHAGASYLRRTLYGREPSAPGSPAPTGPRVNIVERVQALGVDRFVRQGGAPLVVGGVVTTRAQPPSPLLHLSNLIRSSAAAKKDEGLTSATTTTVDTTTVAPGGIMSTPRITSPGERRPKLPLGAPMGIPGQPGTGQLDSRITQLKPGQRADLGTVGFVASRPRPSGLGTVPGRGDTKMGTVGWTSLGRKGGLL